MNCIIYSLFYLSDDAPPRKCYFYVGQTNDIARRENEHRKAKEKRHEDVYEFIRSLDRKAIPWIMESLQEVRGDQYAGDSERWFVIKLTREGHMLTNMRHGNLVYNKELEEQIKNFKIRNVSDVRIDSCKRRYAKSRKLRRKLLDAELRKVGIPNVSADKFLPSRIRKRLLSQNCTQIEKGVKLVEIIRSIRAEPILRGIMEEIERNK
jgi:hypothetical protein